MYSTIFTLKHYPEKARFYYPFNIMGTLWWVIAHINMNTVLRDAVYKYIVVSSGSRCRCLVACSLCWQVHGWPTVHPGCKQSDRQVGEGEHCLWRAALHRTGWPHLVPCESSVPVARQSYEEHSLSEFDPM
jgi:hypothetical protein